VRPPGVRSTLIHPLHLIRPLNTNTHSHTHAPKHSEIARFCAAFLAREVRSHAAFTAAGPARDVPAALAAAFHRMDELLRAARPAPPSARLAATAAHLSPPPPSTLAAEVEGEEGGEEDAGASAAGAPPSSSSGDENAAPAAQAGAAADGAPQPSSSSSAPPLPPSHASTLAAAAAARAQAGCTALVAVVSGTDVWVANAGDSRAVLCTAAGAAVALSSDHKPGEPGEAARIRAAGGFVAAVGGVARVNGSLALSRAIGDLAFKDPAHSPPAQVITAEPDVRHFSLSEGDAFLLLACDGVWDVLGNQEAVDVARRALEGEAGSPAAAAEALLDACLSPDPRLSRGAGCDNMTAAVVVLPTHPRKAGEGGGGKGGGSVEVGEARAQAAAPAAAAVPAPAAVAR
jgi:protein phosphatase 1G